MQTSRRAFNAALASLAVGGALAACKGSKGKKITLGFISSWTDGVCMTHFTKVQLEKNGYSTELKDISEPSVLYTGLQQSNIDLYASAWPEVTHKQYMDQYGDLESLVTNYGEGKEDDAATEWSDNHPEFDFKKS